MKPFLDALTQAFPAHAVSTDAGDLESYGKDWTRVYSPAPCAVVFAESTADVVKLVELCAEHGVPLVPSGGRTGLSGGAVASKGEVVLSFEKMARIDAVDRLAQTVRVQAGAVTQAVHEHCAKEGLTWPIDFASKGSSHVGGNISTNAGGVKVIRYGLTRQWVLGLQVVTADGEILELNGALEKNQTGLDLRQLFIGTEGTLGIVTEATLKLTRLPRESEVLFLALGGVPAVLALFRAAREERFTINAFEMIGDNCLRSVMSHRSIASPFGAAAPYYVLMEVEKPESEEGRARLEEWLAGLFEKGMVTDGVLASSSKERENLWALREGISESLAARGMVHKHDIALPISRLQAFIDEFLASLAASYRGHELFLFGHVGDGNLHVNLLKPAAMAKEAFLVDTKKIDADIFALVKKHGGAVSAEHGIGLLKKHALTFSRSAAEIDEMRRIKKAMDPRGILNPGKIFD